MNETGKEGNPGKVSWSVPKRLTMQTQDLHSRQGKVESMLKKKKKKSPMGCIHEKKSGLGIAIHDTWISHNTINCNLFTRDPFTIYKRV